MKMKSKNIVRHVLVLLIILAGCTTHQESTYPGFVRKERNVFLMENHSHALMAWHLSGVSGSTLIHLDAHDDCRKTDSDKTERLRHLLQKGRYQHIFNHSDTGSFLNFDVRDSDMLFDLGNFICPSMELGLVSDVYWVVPQPRISAEQQQSLAALMERNLPGARETGTHFPSGGFEMIWDKHLIRIVTLEELPAMKDGCLLDIDIDFFAFPRAMTEEHLVARVNRDPEDVFRYLQSRVPEPQTVTISASVWGGYLPLLLRFLGDAAYDFFTSGTFPDDASHLLSAYRSIRSNDLKILGNPSLPQYRAAYSHFVGLTSLSKGNTEACRRSMFQATSLNDVYKKGLLDGAEALIAMNRYETALQFIDDFKTLNNGSSYNSTAIEAMILASAGRPQSALKLSSSLVKWDSNPYTLLIHGSTLKAAGRMQEAEDTFKQILQIDPRNAAAHFNIGTIRDSLGDLAAATSEYKTAILLRNDFWQAYDNLGYLMLRRGDLTTAEALLSRAVEINPFSISAINNLGLVYARQNNLPVAIPIFRKGASLNPKHAMLGLNLAEALIVTGELEEAKTICLAILKRERNVKAQELLTRASGSAPR